MDEEAESTGSAEPPSPRDRAGQASIVLAVHLDGDDTDPPTLGWIEPQFRRVAALADVRAAEISLAIVGDRDMTRINQQYHQQHTTTDVLTFQMRRAAEPTSPDVDAAPIEGEIILCLDEARRQAQLRGHHARVELLLYAVHGLLHLIGYDDLDEADAQRMHEREDQLLAAVGIGPVYAAESKESQT